MLPREFDQEAPAVRRALVWSTVDGSLFCVMDGLGGFALALYAVALGMPALTIGLLGSLPILAGSVSQVFSPLLERACGSRKRTVILGILAQGLSWLLVPWVADLPPGWLQQAGLIGIVSSGLVGMFIIVPSWSAWMGDLVQPRLREQYFAWRALPCQLCYFLAILGMGEWVHAREADPAQALASFRALFLAAGTARLLCIVCLLFQHEPPAGGGAWAEESPIKAPPGLARVAVFFAAFNLAVFLSAPYFAPYMRTKEVALNYRQIAWIMAVPFLVKMLFLPAWARAAGRYGNRRVILVSGTLTGLMPILWMFSHDWRWLIAVQVLNGMVWGGIELCELPYLLEMTHASERTRRLAGYFSFRNFFGCVGAVGGDFAMKRVTAARGGTPYLVTFLLSGIGRFAVMLWGRRRLPEPDATDRRAGPRHILSEVLLLR